MTLEQKCNEVIENGRYWEAAEARIALDELQREQTRHEEQLKLIEEGFDLECWNGWRGK